MVSLTCSGSLGGPSLVSVSSGCLVSVMSCPGERFSWLNASVPCLVRQLECPALLLSFALPERCVRASLSCSGVPVLVDTSVNRSADPCVVTRRDCTANETCEDWTRVCDSPDECVWKRRPCASGCTIPNVKNQCNCPFDFFPPTCLRKRSSQCFFRLVSPVPRCEAVDLKDQRAVDVDPVCHRYRTTDSVSFRYRLNCSFTEAVNLTTTSNFSYAILDSASNWALSTSRASSWVAQLKVFV